MKFKSLFALLLCVCMFTPTLAQAQVTTSTPAADLRSDLDHLLSEHFVFATLAMMKRYSGAKDADQAYNALDQNAKNMTPAIASIYGDAGAKEFERIFTSHNKYTDDYVKALKKNDTKAVQQAEANIKGFVNEFAAFLSTATAGKLPKGPAADAIREHEKWVQDTFDLYAKGDYKASYQNYRKGYKQMFTISKVLATAITTQFPDKFKNTKPDTKAADLRSNLNHLAGEHFALAVVGMQKGYDKSEDYDISMWAEKEHTADFKAAIASIYGQQGADGFEKIWTSDHIKAQDELVQATSTGDKAGIEKAKVKLSKFAREFGAFLGTATENNLPAEAATAAIQKHEDTATLTFDQYVNKDYDTSYQTFRDGYKLMFGIGKALGEAIVKQSPEKFSDQAMPEKMPKTGDEPMTSSNNIILWTSVVAILVIGGGLLVYRKQAVK
jgi:hypothetical protein